MDRESGLTDLFRGALSILEFENSLIVFDEINPFEIKNVKQYFEMNDDCFFGSFLSSLLVGRVRNLFYYIIIPPRDG